MPRPRTDSPLPVTPGSEKIDVISQFVEIQQDVVFIVEFSIWVQIAVCRLLNVKHAFPEATVHDKAFSTNFHCLIKAFA